ncbi:MAG: glycosyltransferase family 39 protein [Candidatus Geothermarchaeales archaeon]
MGFTFGMPVWMRKHYFILSSLTLLEVITHFGQIYEDSRHYIKITYLFEGKNVAVDPYGFLRPLVPWLATFLDPMVGVGNAYGIVNSIFWLLATLIFYRFSLRVLNSRNQALYSAILFTSSRPLLIYGAAVLTDMCGYLFILIGIYLICFFHERWRDVFLASILIGIGALGREVVLVCIVFALLYAIALRKMGFKKLVVFIFISSVFLLIWTYHVGSPLRHIFWYDKAVRGSFEKGNFGPIPLAKSLAGAFWFSLFLAFVGFTRESGESLKLQYVVFISLIAPLFLIPSDFRFTFILYPSILTLAGKGVEHFAGIISEKPWFRILNERQWIPALLLLHVAFNNLVAYDFVSLPIP